MQSDSAYLFCLYAEDVRQEISGQMSIIGVFQGGLRVAAVPTQIPKMVIVANLRLPPEMAPNSVRLEVHQNGQVLQTIEPPPDFLQSAITQSISQKNYGCAMQFVIGLAGLPVASTGKFDVRAVVDDAIVKGNALEISVAEG